MGTVAAMILAGGQSSRMGQDKALICLHDIPLLRRIHDVAAQCAATVYVVTPWVERYAAILPATCQLIQEQPGRDEGQNGSTHGPLLGFAQGWAQLPNSVDWVLLLACDLPYLDGAVLQGWSQMLDQVDARAIALVPRRYQRWEPLCGFYRVAALPQLMAFIQQGGRSFQRWLDQSVVQPLSIPVMESAPDPLFNCNTPDDLAHLQQQSP